MLCSNLTKCRKRLFLRETCKVYTILLFVIVLSGLLSHVNTSVKHILINHMAFFLSNCMWTECSFVIFTNLYIYISCWLFMYILFNPAHFISLHMNYMALLSTVFSQWFLASLFCFVHLCTTLWFPICVVNIIHANTAFEYGWSLKSKYIMWDTTEEEGFGWVCCVSKTATVGTLVPERTICSTWWSGSQRVGVTPPVRVYSAQRHPCAADWHSPTSRNGSKNTQPINQLRPFDAFWFSAYSL